MMQTASEVCWKVTEHSAWPLETENLEVRNWGTSKFVGESACAPNEQENRVVEYQYQCKCFSSLTTY